MPPPSHATISRPRERSERLQPEVGTALIRIRGARTHNLKNIDLDLPRNRLIVITGPVRLGQVARSPSTRSTPRASAATSRSLSAYARQFLQLMEKPDVDLIEGLSPAISIEQKATSHNPRSTVGTVTEIHDYLRLLFARVGDAALPRPRHRARGADASARWSTTMLALPRGHAADDARAGGRRPQGRARSSSSSELRAQGFVRVRVDGKVHEIDARAEARRRREAHDRGRRRPAASVRADAASSASPRSFETALRIADGRAHRASRWTTTERERAPVLRASSPARSAATRCPSSSRGCSRSTTRWAPARRCDGLGVDHVLRSRSASSRFPQLSLAGGAISGWDRRNQYYFPMLAVARQALRLRPRDAVRRAAASARSRSCCTAAATRRSSSRYLTERGAARSSASTRSKASCPNLERRYRETDSVAVREELAQVPAARKPCPECGGTRLQREARTSWSVDGDDARRSTSLGAAAATTRWRSSSSLTLDGQQGRDRRQDRQGDRDRAAVPEQRRPRLPHARPQRRDALRRRGAAHPAREPDRLGPDRRDVRARRAVDRPAPARQRAPARHAEAPARPRQHA